MKTLGIAIALLAGILLLLSAARAEEAWVKEQIVPGGSAYKGRPIVWEDKVYYTDQTSGSNDIWVWDRAGGARPVLNTPVHENVWAAYEDKLAITEYTNGQFDLYLWDPVNGKRAISTAPGNQYEADLYGDLLVWRDNRGPVPQIYKWDPINGQQIVSPSPYRQEKPRVFGDTIVWDQNDGAGHNDSYMWDPRDGTKKISTYIYSMGFPDIYGDRVLMTLPYDPWLLDPYGIWEYKMGQGLVGPLVPYVSAYHIRTWGDSVTWVNRGGDYGSILVWTPGIGTTRLCTGTGLYPDLYDKTVAWSEADNSIWMAQLVPEPTGLLTFVSLFGLWGLARRRRRRL